MIRLSIFMALSLSLIAPLAMAETLIVGNKREHTISFIDLASGAEIRRVETGRAPHEVAVSPDGTLAVIVSYREQNYLGHTLHVHDVQTGEELKVIDIAEHFAPHGLKWIGQTSRVIATTEASQDVVIVDIDTGSVVNSVKTNVEGSHMVSLSPDNRRAYVGNIADGSFSVIDVDNATLIKTVKAGTGTEAVGISPDGSEIWVGNNGSRNIMVFDAQSLTRELTIDSRGVPIRVEFSPDGDYVAVSEFDTNHVSILHADTHDHVARIDLSRVGASVPVTMLWSRDSQRLWVAATGSENVVEISRDDWQIIRTLPAGDGSDGLGYSPVKITAEAPID